MRAIVCALAVVTIACGGSRANAPAVSTARAAIPCVIEAADSVMIRGAALYPACAVDRQALLLNGREAMSGYRPTRDCVSATIRFVVDTSGAAEDGARIVTTNDPGFARALIRSLGSWRYRPAELGGRKVRQLVTEGSAIESFTRTVAMPAGGARPSPSSIGPPPSRPSC